MQPFEILLHDMYASRTKLLTARMYCAESLGEFELKGVAGPMVLMECFVDREAWARHQPQQPEPPQPPQLLL